MCTRTFIAALFIIAAGSVGGGELTAKTEEKTFWGDGNSFYLVLGVSYMGVHNC